MSDTPLPEGITPSPGGGCVISLNPAAMRAAKAGVPAEARPSTFGAPAPAPVAAPAAQPGPAPVRFTLTGDPDARYHDSPAADHVRWINEAVAAGQISPERAAAALREAGISAAVDGRSVAQQAHDEHFGAAQGGYKPDDFTHLQTPGAAGMTIAELGAADTAAREAFAHLGIAPRSAQSLLNAIAAAERQMADAGATADGQTALLSKWQSQIAGAMQNENAMQNEQLWKPIADLVKGAEKNGLIERMKASGLFFNPNVFLALHNHAQNRSAWRASRPTK